jgi:hypothetical protein
LLRPAVRVHGPCNSPPADRSSSSPEF